MKTISSLLIWLCFIPAAILNGGVREYILHPLLPHPYDLATSGVMLSGLIFGLTFILLPYLGKLRIREQCGIGAVWMLLTILFETLLILTKQSSFEILLQSYNPMHGNLWLLVVLTTGVSPLLVSHIRNCTDQSSSGIIAVTHHKKQYLNLLLMADEQEDMIERYLERGEMFVCKQKGTAVAVLVITREKTNTYEIKNLAVHPSFRAKGYGKKMIDFIWDHYPHCRTLYVGTGDSPATVPFYEKCGFTYSHTLPDFFTTHYDHPIIEEGIILKDMIYLKKERK